MKVLQRLDGRSVDPSSDWRFRLGMFLRTRGCVALFVLLLTLRSSAYAGMTVYTLSDVARMRLEDISFFSVVLLACVFVIKWLWNMLARDFPNLPKLTFGRAAALTTLVSLLLLMVLAMISGAREVLSPGAWRRQGHGYRLNADANETTRRQGLEALRAALFDFAKRHEGKFPSHDFDQEIPEKIWQSPDGVGSHYIYLGGQKANGGKRLLAYEPAVFGDSRFCLYTDGEIAMVPKDQIHLSPKQP